MKKIYKIALFVCVFVLIILLPSKVEAASKASLTKKIKSNTSQKIIKTYYDDFDGDGTKEMFAIVGKKEDDATYIYFASDKIVKAVKNGMYDGGGYVYTPGKGKGICKVSSKQKLFVTETGGYGSGSTSMCFYVREGMPVKVTKAGEGLTHISGKNFNIFPSAFDQSSNGTGHTWKAYYLKWNGTKFTEYTASKISEAKLKKYSGATSILKNIKKAGYSVRSIYLRKNNTIQINVRSKAAYGVYSNENVTLKIKGKKVSAPAINTYGRNYVEKRSYGGIYKAKIF